MAEFRVLEANHTGFTVSDLGRTVAFFRDVLGYELISKDTRDPAYIQHVIGVDGAEIMVAYLRGFGHTLELFEFSGPADRGSVRPRACDVGFFHIALYVDDIDAAIDACRPFGVQPIATPIEVKTGPNKGGKVAYLRDPDGITIELMMRPDRG